MAVRRNLWLILAAAVCAIAGFSLQAHAGKLNDVRDAVRGDSDGGQESSEDNDLFCEEDEFWWPSDSPRKRQWWQDWIPGAYFVAHPYANGHRGYLFTTGEICNREILILEDTHESFAVYDPGAELLNRQPGLSSWSLRLAAEYAYDNGPVHRPNISASSDSIYRFGLATRWTHYIEPLSGGGIDQITIGAINLTYRFVQSDIAEARLGLGCRIIHDGDFSAGVNLAYLMNVFPVQPLVFSMAGDAGTLGEALYLHGRLSIGAQLGPVEPYLGYDLVRIIGASADVVFKGPVAGLRIWL